jgi:hypothetical protein
VDPTLSNVIPEHQTSLYNQNIHSASLSTSCGYIKKSSRLKINSPIGAISQGLLHEVISFASGIIEAKPSKDTLDTVSTGLGSPFFQGELEEPKIIHEPLFLLPECVKVS